MTLIEELRLSMRFKRASIRDMARKIKASGLPRTAHPLRAAMRELDLLRRAKLLLEAQEAELDYLRRGFYQRT